MEKLRTYLATQGIRQSAFADTVGVSKGYVTELLNGRKTPGLQLAVKIGRVTDGDVPPEAWVIAVGISE